MKKTALKKLSLDRESIRLLADRLDRVAGGVSGDRHCNYTADATCPNTDVCTGPGPTQLGDCI